MIATTKTTANNNTVLIFHLAVMYDCRNCSKYNVFKKKQLVYAARTDGRKLNVQI